jgi:hypothetical protein
MHSLEKLAEPCATRLVREEVGEMTLRDHDDNAVYLPMTYGRRTTYRMYCYKQGWFAETTHSGNYKKKWVGKGPEKKNIVSYTTFYNYWKVVFPHIKISNRREDVCNWCFIFMQRKKYDYCQSCDDDDLSAVSGDSYHSDNSHGCGGGTVRQYDDDLLGTEVSLDDDCLVDPIAETEITEELIHEAVRHVRSAKVQRAYMKKKEAAALEDRKNNVPLYDSEHAIVFDYMQNLELPHLGFEQPGVTYYLKKWVMNCFGVVNLAHVFTDVEHLGRIGAFMRAYVYEEWEGGKGGDNMASLMLQSLRDEGLMKEDDNGDPVKMGKLTAFCDNCTGQNKNNTVIRMAAYLVESGYFAEVSIVFLIVGTHEECM